MDEIEAAKAGLLGAEEAFFEAERVGAPEEVLSDLQEQVGMAEAAYFRACDTWTPLTFADVGGVVAANGLVYSDADPGL